MTGMPANGRQFDSYIDVLSNSRDGRETPTVRQPFRPMNQSGRCLRVGLGRREIATFASTETRRCRPVYMSARRHESDNVIISPQISCYRTTWSRGGSFSLYTSTSRLPSPWFVSCIAR